MIHLNCRDCGRFIHHGDQCETCQKLDEATPNNDFRGYMEAITGERIPEDDDEG